MDVTESQNICWRFLRTSATARSPMHVPTGILPGGNTGSDEKHCGFVQNFFTGGRP